MQGYSTRQKQLVSEFFEANRGRDITVNEAAHSLAGKVGLSSVYRIVGMLEAEGRLKKFFKENDKKQSVYRYYDPKVCPKHLHLKCTECGSVSHLDEDDTAKIANIIGKEFSLSNEDTTLFGICNICKKG